MGTEINKQGDIVVDGLSIHDVPDLAPKEHRESSGSDAALKAYLESMITRQFIQWSELSQRKYPPNQWRVNHLVPLGGRTIIAAPSNESKSWFAMNMARDIAAGTKFLNHDDFATEQSNVLYIENESAPVEIQRRGHKLNYDAVKERIWLFDGEQFPNLLTIQSVESLLQVIEEKNIGTIFIDPLISIATGIKSEKAEEMRPFFANFKRLTDKNITVVFVDHCRKPVHFENRNIPNKHQLFGSEDKLASIESLIMLRAKPDIGIINVFHLKNRTGKMYAPFKVQLSEEMDLNDMGALSMTYAGLLDEHGLELDDVKELVKVFIDEQGTTVDMSSIIEGLTGKVGKSKIELALKSMRDLNQIVFQKTGNKYVYLPGGGEIQNKEDTSIAK